MSRIPVVIVVAIAENGVIGRAGDLPWRISSDLKHFRALTLGHPVLMGRRTFVSLGRPLPGRTNVVVSRDPAFAAEGAAVANSFANGLAVAEADALRRGDAAVMVIGGSHLFAEALAIADRLEVTRVHSRPEGDTYFPPIHPGIWREVACRAGQRGPKDESAFSFCTYERTREAVPDGAAAARPPVEPGVGFR